MIAGLTNLNLLRIINLFILELEEIGNRLQEGMEKYRRTKDRCVS